MTNNCLSAKICEICEINPKYWCDYADCFCPIEHQGNFNPKCPKQAVTKECDARSNKLKYPNLDKSQNKLKLINLLVDTGHYVTLSKSFCEISNGDFDFVHDCHGEYFAIRGNNLCGALYNYLTGWIEEKTRIPSKEGAISDWQDTSHILQKEECYSPVGYDRYREDVCKLKKVLKNSKWII